MNDQAVHLPPSPWNPRRLDSLGVSLDGAGELLGHVQKNLSPWVAPGRAVLGRARESIDMARQGMEAGRKWKSIEYQACIPDGLDTSKYDRKEDLWRAKYSQQIPPEALRGTLYFPKEVLSRVASGLR